jgi:NodT family efflux transporter outer membrane factor (OMF) lipoprotein
LPVLPEAFPSAPKEQDQAVVLSDRWWLLFQEPELTLLMERIRESNLDLVQARARLAQAQAALAAAGAARLPSVHLAAQAGWVRQAGLAGTITTETFQLSTEASWEMDLWGKAQAREKASRLEVAVHEQEGEALYLSLSVQAADLFYLAWELKEQVKLQDQLLATHGEILAGLERRYQAGLLGASEIHQARQNEAAARAQRSTWEGSLAVTRNALAVLTGHFPGASAPLGAARLPLLEPLAVGLPAFLLARRPDLQAAAARVAAADARVAAALAERFPSFNLVGRMGGASSDLRQLLSASNLVGNLLLSVLQPVFDGGRRRAEAARTEAIYQEAVARYQQTFLRAFQEVEDALSRRQTTEARLESLKERRRLAWETRHLALERRQEGIGDYLSLLTAELRLGEAESALLTVRRQLVSDQLTLIRALGGGWGSEASVNLPGRKQ